MEAEGKPVIEPLTTRELIDRLFEQHDREIHAIFLRLLGVESEVEAGGAA